MVLFGGVISVTGIAFLMFSVLAITAVGYALGRITIKGVSLGTAGVFIVALLYGALFASPLGATVVQKISGGDVQTIAELLNLDAATVTESIGALKFDISSNALKIVEQLGLILFVTSVGFIAGPNFFKNLKQNYKSYIVLGLIIILAGGGSCVACYFIGKGGAADLAGGTKELVAMLVGILSGSLTSTPAFAAAKATVPEFESAVTVGHGIAYLFGVIGVVLFVQLIPKISKANMAEERAKIQIVETGKAKKEYKGKLINMDSFGFMAFALAALIGIVVGAIKIPLSNKGLSGTTFSLTTTGGALITALIFGHFGHIGPVNVKIEKRVLEVFREFGLMLFLIGAGVAGGAKFLEYFKPIYFVYGVIMTIVPMIIGYIFAKYVLKLSLLNNLGSITGGMTSTPALGTLINVAGTDDVASAYAATYPISLIAVVVVSQLICTFLG